LALIGAEGVVLTDLRPVGVIQVDGQRFDALSETGLIRAGSRVKVTKIDSNQVKVRGI
jgi:membrane-bound serine protease (ClpP class)